MKGKGQVEGEVILQIVPEFLTNEKRELMICRLFTGQKFRKKLTPTPALYPSSKISDSCSPLWTANPGNMSWEDEGEFKDPLNMTFPIPPPLIEMDRVVNILKIIFHVIDQTWSS